MSDAPTETIMSKTTIQQPVSVNEAESKAGFAAPPGSGHLGGFTLLRGKLKEGQCAECAVVHEPEMPHNQQSLFWQYSFREKHGRWPTWADALAHCTPEMRAQWVTALAEHGVIVPNNTVSNAYGADKAPTQPNASTP